MSTRIFFAGILGGIVMFIWNWIGHDVLPLGRTGVSELPNQQTIRDALAANLTADGFYLFPMPKLDPNATGKEKRAAMEQAMKEMASGPSGLLVYHPTRQFVFGKLLAIEFGAEVIEALLIAWLLAQTGIASFAGRVGFVIVAGILAAMATNVSYWNFYGFPGAYTAAYMSIQLIGFLCAGIVAAILLRRSPATP